MTAYREPYKRPVCMQCGNTVKVETDRNLVPRGQFMRSKDKQHFFCTMQCGVLWAIGRIQSDKEYEATIQRSGTK